MASSRLERLRMLLQADLAALPDVLVDIDESEGDLKPDLEPFVPELEQDDKAATTWIDPETQRNFLRVPSDAEDSDAGCVLELVPLTDPKDAPALTPDCTCVSTPLEQDKPSSPSLGLRRGQLAPSELAFCSILALAKFPYKHIEKRTSESVAGRFFNAGKFWMRSWDLFYVWPLNESKPLLLISETQFSDLLKEIDSVFQHLHLCSQKETYWENGLLVQFEDHPRLRPRYLGRSATRNCYDDMAANIPSINFTLSYEKKAAAPDDRSLEAFRRIFEECMESQKQKSKQTKAAKKASRIAQQQFIGKQLKRSQRYLGLRPKYALGATTPGIITNDKLLAPIDPERLAPYPFEQQPIFIAVDVEAFEFDHNAITEVGITTLDTKELVDIAPGKDGANWFAKARSRHFRIEENKHIVNFENVQGCPDRFEFGESEFVRITDAPALIASCFREPFSRRQTREELEASFAAQSDTTESSNNGSPEPKRAIILIGHDPNADIKYLRKLGYNPLGASNLVEVFDTRTLYRVYRREQPLSSLGTILYHFDMVGWNLHNAGNDAAYTLQVFLGIAIRDATRRGDPKLVEEYKERAQQALKERLSDAVDIHEAEQQAFEADVEDDGGEPIETKSLEPRPFNGTRHFLPQGAVPAPAAGDQGLETSRYATANGGVPKQENWFPFRGSRNRNNGHTFTDRVNRRSYRSPPEETPKRPSFIVDENGEICLNPAIYEDVMGTSNPKGENAKTVQESDGSVESLKNTECAQESVVTREKPEGRQGPEEDLLDFGQPTVSGLDPITEDPREQDASNGKVRATEDSKVDETATPKKTGC